MTDLTTAQRHARRATGGCDCADPECALPEGRCYLCGNPYPHCSGTSGLEFTVCPKCSPQVIALYDHEARLLPLLARVAVDLRRKREQNTRLRDRLWRGGKDLERINARLALIDAAIEAREEPGVEGPPWAPFDEDGRGGFCIQRDDAQDHFESDEAAAHYVAKRLGIEMTYPEGA